MYYFCTCTIACAKLCIFYRVAKKMVKNLHKVAPNVHIFGVLCKKKHPIQPCGVKIR